MPNTHNPSVVLTDLSFAWPDGSTVLEHVTAAVGAGRTGLTGANGTGKSTLLRLIAGELAPTSGSVIADGEVSYLPQNLVLDTDATVADLLGVAAPLRALRAVEAGDTAPENFEVIGDDPDAWNVEARADAALDAAGLGGHGGHGGLTLDRRAGTLSGGETVLAAVTGLRMRSSRVEGGGVVLLDEPTNNLDRRARRNLYDAVAEWPGALIVVSHDVELLDLMDDTAELRTGSLSIYGGNYSGYRRHLEQEQAAAEQALRTAEQKLKTEERQRAEAQTKLARRQRYARTDFENRRKPKMIMNQRKTEAQVSAGKLRGELDVKVDAARREKERQAGRVRDDSAIRITLPDPGVPAGRRLAELSGESGATPDTTVVLQGPERLALTGPNGIGKTRLVEELVHGGGDGDDGDGGGRRAQRFTDRVGYLPQRLDHLDDDASVLDTVRDAAPGSTVQQVRANLARFLFPAGDVLRTVGDLSGGERFRVALARLLLADPANELLVLDEPTNNLDLDSVDALVTALEDYRGGLIVVSHDENFLGRLGIDTRVELDEDGLHCR